MRFLSLSSVGSLLLAGQSVAATIRIPADYLTIQAGIDNAIDGDTVLVAPGIYFENLNFDGKAITLASESGPHNTVIDGRRVEAVITFDSREGLDSVVSGFTLQNGYASSGSGIMALGSSPTIVSNIFQNNAQPSGSFGAAIGGNGASPIVEKNIFRNNTADNQFLSGVVSFVNGSSPLIANNVFLNNACRAINMTLPEGNRPVVVNNTFINNQVGIRVNAGVNTSGHSYFNNILIGNSIGLDVDSGSAMRYPTWVNNLVFGGQIAYNGIPNQTGLNGNISANPLFACFDAGDYRLRPSSPCIDAGNNAAPQLPSEDFEGNERITAGQSNGPAIVDLGAFEFNPALPADPCVALTVSCLPPLTVECAYTATITAVVSQPEGRALTVQWFVNGLLAKQELIPARDSPADVNVSYMAELPVGANLVGVTVDDAWHNSARCSSIVTIADIKPPQLVPLTDQTVEFINETGAVVTFTPQVLDPCSVGMQVTCVPPSGTTFPIGTNRVVCTGVPSSGDTSQATFAITVLGARGLKNDILSEMIARRAVSPWHHFWPLDNAIALLRSALAEEAWLDETHLTQNHRGNVFLEEAKAAAMLRLLMGLRQSRISDATLRDWQSRLAKADQLLARVEIATAENSHASPLHVARALKELSRGDEAAAKQHYYLAILHYKKAWNLARQ